MPFPSNQPVQMRKKPFSGSIKCGKCHQSKPGMFFLDPNGLFVCPDCSGTFTKDVYVAPKP